MKQYEFNRMQYDRVRKMDHNQMKSYLQGVFDNGFRCGQKGNENGKVTPFFDLTGLGEKIKNLRGVGGAKATMIVDEVKKYLEEQL